MLWSFNVLLDTYYTSLCTHTTLLFANRHFTEAKTCTWCTSPRSYQRWWLPTCDVRCKNNQEFRRTSIQHKWHSELTSHSCSLLVNELQLQSLALKLVFNMVCILWGFVVAVVILRNVFSFYCFQVVVWFFFNDNGDEDIYRTK